MYFIQTHMCVYHSVPQSQGHAVQVENTCILAPYSSAPRNTEERPDQSVAQGRYLFLPEDAVGQRA